MLKCQRILIVILMQMADCQHKLPFGNPKNAICSFDKILKTKFSNNTEQALSEMCSCMRGLDLHV